MGLFTRFFRQNKPSIDKNQIEKEIKVAFVFNSYFKGEDINQKRHYIDKALIQFLDYYGQERLIGDIEVLSSDEYRGISFSFKFLCSLNQSEEIRKYLLATLKANYYEPESETTKD